MEFFLLKPYEEGCKLKLTGRDPALPVLKSLGGGELPDFTVRPMALISTRFKELLEQYLPSMDFGPCLLEGKDTPDFWTFHPKELDVSQAVYRPDGTVEAVSYNGLLPVFMVPNYKKVSYVIILALAESLLRRSYLNLGLERIKVLGGESE